MADETNTQPDAPEPDESQQPTPDGIGKQAEPEPDWKAKYEAMKAQSRKWEERSKANKAAADKLEQTESELDKLAAANKDLTGKLSAYETAEEHRSWCSQAAKDSGVPAGLLEQALSCSDEDSLGKLAESLKQYADSAKPLGVPHLSDTPQHQADSALAFAHRLLSGAE